MKNFKMLSEDLKNYDALDNCQKQCITDYISCPNSDDCQYDGKDNSCCVNCKIRWLEMEVNNG